MLLVLYVGFFFNSKFVVSQEKTLYYWLLFLSMLFPILFFLIMYFYISIREDKGKLGIAGEDCNKNNI
tara:strand:+ start:1168 stop:1371 length:204 start_codon:yes stop_codon:yes gene_type:complete